MFKTFINSASTKYSLVVAIWVAAFAGQALRYAIGWAGFAVVDFLLFGLVFVVFKDHLKFSLQKIPYPLFIFLIWCFISVTWSQYPLETLLGSGLQLITAYVGYVLASTLSWGQLLKTLSSAFKFILASSLLLELYVAVFIRGPLNPFVDAVPGYAWVEGNLFNGADIQGIVGNRNLLGFVALLSICIFAIQFFASKKNVRHAIWFVVAFGTIYLTQSATVTVAVVAVFLLSLLAISMRKLLVQNHKYLYYFGGGAIIALLAVCVIYSSPLLALIGRDDDFTGRTTIWSNVWNLVAMHPIVGWGWVSYWTPWVEPFTNLAILDGTQFLQAHNALLDIVFQTGIVGAVLAIAVAIIASIRSWRIAVNPVKAKTDLLNVVPFQTLLPVLLMACLLVQSLSESRLLIEGNWLLFVLLACKVKIEAPEYGSFKIHK
jgi:exopolysaccharide production protein ExoQ